MNETPVDKARPRFRLEIKHLLWATALVASGLAFHKDTAVCSMLIIGLWAIRFYTRASWLGWKILIALGILLLVVAALLPTVQVTRGWGSHRIHCSNNLRQIQFAMLNYETAFGRFPVDTETLNSKGELIRASWRVHILPFLGMQNIYDAYRFDEPWDSPANLALQKQVVGTRFFECPSHDHGGKTPYKAIVGPGTAFEFGKKIGLAECLDGSSNTISLVEDHSDPVDFFEPRDISVADAVSLFNGSTKENCVHFVQEHTFSRVFYGPNFSLLNGSAWPAFPENKIDKGAFLIADSKLFDPETDISVCIEYRWDKIISFAACVLLLLFYPFLWVIAAKRYAANAIADHTDELRAHAL